MTNPQPEIDPYDTSWQNLKLIASAGTAPACVAWPNTPSGERLKALTERLPLVVDPEIDAAAKRFGAKPQVSEKHLERMERYAAEAGAAEAAAAESRQRPVPANSNKKSLPFPGIMSSGEFVRDFVPPEYHVDGVIQAAFLYALTGMTGAGKTAVLLLLSYCTATGSNLGDKEVRKGRVLYSAGENPTDVKMRWIAMAHHIGFDPEEIDVHFVGGVYSIPERISEISAWSQKNGDVDLVIIDTSAAYFHGDDENSNAQLGNHARDMRKLTELPGGPCVLVAAHPVKNATMENLLPKGGGSFLNEIDGNLTLAKVPGGSRMHWQGKHRGVDFAPIHFDLQTVEAPALVDKRGRTIPTVMAQAITSKDARANADTARRDEDDVLLEIRRDGKLSLAGMAERCGWYSNGEPHKDRARRATDKLKKEKLATCVRRVWKLTKIGEDAAVDVAGERHRAAGIAGFLSSRHGEEE